VSVSLARQFLGFTAGTRHASVHSSHPHPAGVPVAATPCHAGALGLLGSARKDLERTHLLATSGAAAEALFCPLARGQGPRLVRRSRPPLTPRRARHRQRRSLPAVATARARISGGAGRAWPPTNVSTSASAFGSRFVSLPPFPGPSPRTCRHSSVACSYADMWASDLSLLTRVISCN
jgi:hypothetical protein